MTTYCLLAVFKTRLVDVLHFYVMSLLVCLLSLLSEPIYSFDYLTQYNVTLLFPLVINELKPKVVQ